MLSLPEATCLRESIICSGVGSPMYLPRAKTCKMMDTSAVLAFPYRGAEQLVGRKWKDEDVSGGKLHKRGEVPASDWSDAIGNCSGVGVSVPFAAVLAMVKNHAQARHTPLQHTSTRFQRHSDTSSQTDTSAGPYILSAHPTRRQHSSDRPPSTPRPSATIRPLPDKDSNRPFRDTTREHAIQAPA